LARRADTPRGYLGLAAHPSLFGLAPCGVYPAPDVTAGAVRSYRTFSPLPCASRRRRYLLCGTSRLEALTLRSRTLSGTLPCGVRTFLSRSCDRQRPPSCSLTYRIAQVRPGCAACKILMALWISPPARRMFLAAGPISGNLNGHPQNLQTILKPENLQG
jgi:hypothetical protein